MFGGILEGLEFRVCDIKVSMPNRLRLGANR
jgi:hypothetical protein